LKVIVGNHHVSSLPRDIGHRNHMPHPLKRMDDLQFMLRFGSRDDSSARQHAAQCLRADLRQGLSMYRFVDLSIDRSVNAQPATDGLGGCDLVSGNADDPAPSLLARLQIQQRSLRFPFGKEPDQSVQEDDNQDHRGFKAVAHDPGKYSGEACPQIARPQTVADHVLRIVAFPAIKSAAAPNLHAPGNQARTCFDEELCNFF
jgi:hypothetical protein